MADRDLDTNLQIYLWKRFVEHQREEIMNRFTDGQYNFEEDLAELRVMKKLEAFIEKYFSPTEEDE